MADKIFVKGLRFFPKHQNSPEWVLGDLVINLDQFKAWVNGEGKEYLSEYKGEKQLKLQVTRLKDGGLSASVNNYKKEAKEDLPF